MEGVKLRFGEGFVASVATTWVVGAMLGLAPSAATMRVEAVDLTRLDWAFACLTGSLLLLAALTGLVLHELAHAFAAKRAGARNVRVSLSSTSAGTTTMDLRAGAGDPRQARVTLVGPLVNLALFVVGVAALAACWALDAPRAWTWLAAFTALTNALDVFLFPWTQDARDLRWYALARRFGVLRGGHAAAWFRDDEFLGQVAWMNAWATRTVKDFATPEGKEHWVRADAPVADAARAARDGLDWCRAVVDADDRLVGQLHVEDYAAMGRRARDGTLVRGVMRDAVRVRMEDNVRDALVKADGDVAWVVDDAGRPVAFLAEDDVWDQLQVEVAREAVDPIPRKERWTAYWDAARRGWAQRADASNDASDGSVPA